MSLGLQTIGVVLIIIGALDFSGSRPRQYFWEPWLASLQHCLWDPYAHRCIPVQRRGEWSSCAGEYCDHGECDPIPTERHWKV